MIDSLNVFPVPDGDTGTNMNLSMSSGAEEVKKTDNSRLSDVAKDYSKGLLMGARGNSGVILSQILRGFAQEIGEREYVNTKRLAEDFQKAVESSYKAVMKSVEVTILTVTKYVAQKGEEIAENEEDIVQHM